MSEHEDSSVDGQCDCGALKTKGKCVCARKKDKNILKHRIFEDICQNCDCHAKNPYCTLVEFFLHILSQDGDRERTLVQIKCVEKYKYELGVKHSREFGWNDAFMEWVKSGLSKRFAEVYDPELPLNDIYIKTVGNSLN